VIFIDKQLTTCELHNYSGFIYKSKGNYCCTFGVSKQTIMEKSIKNSEIHKVNSLHSEICVAYNNDFTYRKAYKGDWGHWDDLPETSSSNLSCAENDGNSIGQNESPSENTYL
jgi:hypothetical protein